MPEQTVSPGLTLAPPDSSADLGTAPALSKPVGDTLKGLEKYRGKSQFRIYTAPDGSIQVENKSGQVVFGVPKSQLEGIAAEDLQKELAGYLGNGVDGIVGVRDDGTLYVDAGNRFDGSKAPSDLNESSTTSAGGGGAASSGSGAGRGGSGSGSGRGGGGSGGGGSSGGGSSSTGGRTASGGGSTTTTSGGGGIEIGTGGGGNGAGPPIDPNAPLGTDFGGAEGRINPGDQRFNDAGVFDRPGSFTEGLGPDASLNDILLGAMGEQRATRDAALNIQGGLGRTFEDSALRQSNEQNALALGANPFSLDDQTVSRIMGQQGDLIGQNTERLQQSSAARAASQGISRSGIQHADQDRIDIAGAQQLGDAQRGLLVEQATRRPKELEAATRLGTDTLDQQMRQRESIAGGAVNILSQSNPTADAALLGTLAQGGTPQIRIADGNPLNPFGYVPAGNNQGGTNPFMPRL